MKPVNFMDIVSHIEFIKYKKQERYSFMIYAIESHMIFLALDYIIQISS